jgi:hypothetical protein
MIDQIARSSAQELRAGTTGDAEAGLADLHVRQSRHRPYVVVGTVAALVVALGVGGAVGSVLTREGAQDQGGPSHRSSQQATPGVNVPTLGAGSGDACTEPLVTCLGDRTYRFDLVLPVVWAIPPNFGVNSGGGANSLQVESYRQVGPTAGVTVMEHVRASNPSGTAPAQGVADDPRAFVNWVAARPFLDAGKVTRTTLDGRRAWQVRVMLARGSGRGASTCSGEFQCHALTYQSDRERTGIWGNMAAQYVAFRLPGGGTAVVWSWAFTGDVGHLGGLQEAVHSITFPAS